MKKLLLFIVILLTTVYAKATILNVDNNPNRPSGYYSSLPLAINAASAGDTLYVYPSNVSYGTITVTKKLHFFGSGYSSTTGAESQLHYVYLDTTISPASNPSGSTFQGFKISRISCQKPNIVNIVLSGNYFSSYINLSSNCSGWLITNNYISYQIYLNNNSSIIISNNVFNDGYGISTSNSPSVLISHNLFMAWAYFNGVYNATVSDNIFICSTTNPVPSSMAHNNFINNISWRSALNPYTIPPESNSGSGNISNQDPKFETANASGNFDFTKDYHLKVTSPGINNASDGTNIGIYGGSNPFVWGGSFSIPKITESLITNPVINQSTPINVNVKANKAKL